MFAPIRSFVVALAIACGLTAGPAVFAQDATPAGEVVDAAECQVEARTIEELEEFSAAASEESAQSTPEISGIGELTGDPAGEATVEAVTATYRELVACLNAGDYLRIYALYTDAYVQRTIAEGELNLDELQATPSTDQSGSTALIGVSNVRQVGDGQVAARVETSDEATAGTVIIDSLLVQVDDRYLIDAEVVSEAPEAGTPEATDAGDAAAEGDAGATEVVSFDIYFEPAELTIPADTDVTVTLPNQGVTLHNFAIDELGIDVDIEPGATQETVINAPAGVYEYYCNVPGHKAAGMVGTLTVE